MAENIVRPTGPSLADYIARQSGAITPRPSQPTWIGGGLRAGFNELQAAGGAAASAVGKAIGSDTLANWGAEVAARNAAEAQQVGRSDLEVAPWKEGGASVAPWLVYQAAKNIPQFATALAGGALLARGGLRAPAALAEIGTVTPRILGGGGLRAGATVAEQQAARAAGTEFARTLTGATVAGIPIATGSMYQEALERGDPTRGEAVASIALGPVYSALDALQPTQLKGLLQRGMAGNILKRVGTAGAVGAVAEAPQEATQTAMELAFRPDLSVGEKATRVVDAALTGMAVGGFFGSVGGIRRAADTPPQNLSDDDLKAVTDNALSPAEPVAPVEAIGPAAMEADGQRVLPGIPQARPEAMDFETAQPHPFAGVETPDILQQMAKVEDRLQTETATPRETLAAELIRSELALRPAEEVDQAAQTAALTQFARKQVGGNRSLMNAAANFVRKNELKDLVDLYDRVETEASGRSTSKAVLQLAKVLGVGQPRENLTPEQTRFRDAIELRRAQRLQTQGTLDLGEPVPRVAPTALTIAGKEVTPSRDLLVASAAPAISTAPTNVFAEQLATLPQTLQRQQEFEQALAQVTPSPAQQQVQQFREAQTARALTQPFILDTDAAVAGRDRQTNFQRQQVVAGFNALSVAQQASILADFDNDPGAFLAQVKASADPRAYGKILAERVNVPLQVFRQSPSRKSAQAQQFSYTASPAASVQQQIIDILKPQMATILRSKASSQAQRTAAETALTALDSANTLKKQERAVQRAINAFSKSARPAVQEIITNAIQERSATPVYVQPAPQVGGGMGEEVPQAARPAGEAITQGAIAPAGGVQEISEVVTPILQREAGVIATPPPTKRAIRRRRPSESALPQGVTAAPQASSRAAPIEFDAAQEKRLAAQNPEGPFAGVTGNVVATRSVDPRYTEYVGELMKTLELPGVRVLVAQDEDILTDRSAYGLYGSYGMSSSIMTPLAEDRWGEMNQFGPTNRDFYIKIKPGLNEYVTLEVLSHEIGHILERVAYESAPAAQRQALITAYEKWLKAHPGKTIQDRVLALRPVATAEATLTSMPSELKTAEVEDLGYWTGFSEWFADNVAKWATTKEKPLTLVDRFFASLAKRIRRVVQDLAKAVGLEQFLPDAAVETFIESMGPAPARVWVGARKWGDRIEARNAQAALLPSSTRQMSANVGQVVNYINNVKNRLNMGAGVKDWTLQNFALPFSSITHLSESWGPMLARNPKDPTDNPINAIRQASEQSRGFKNTFNQLIAPLLDRMQQFDNEYNRVVLAAAADRLDLDAPWSTHTHHRNSPDKARLRARHAELQQTFNKYRQKGGAKLYRDLRQANEMQTFAQMSGLLTHLVQTDPSVAALTPSFERNAASKYLAASQVNEDLQSSRDYWKRTLDAQLAAVENALQRNETVLAPLKAKNKASPARMTADEKTNLARMQSMSTSMQPIVSLVSDMVRMTSEAPYFHLARQGEYFSSFTLAVDPRTKMPQAEAVDKIATRLAEIGLDNVEISANLKNPKVFIRTETLEQVNALASLLKEFEQQGWVDTSKRRKIGVRGAIEGASEYLTPAYNQIIAKVKAGMLTDDMLADMSSGERAQVKLSQDRLLESVTRSLIDLLPDNKNIKMMLPRKSVQGYSTNLAASVAFRTNVANNSIANLFFAGNSSQAMTEILQAIDTAQNSRDVNVAVGLRRLYQELTLRQANQYETAPSGFMQTMRAATSSYFLALSPGYVMGNMLSISTFLAPELGKTYGVRKSFQTIARTTPKAFRIMQEIFRAGIKRDISMKADIVIDSSVLAKAGLSVAEQQDILELVNENGIDLGSMAREFARLAQGQGASRADVFLSYASAMGAYSETFSRLIAALSARDLYLSRNNDRTGMKRYVGQVMANSMFLYSQDAVARVLTPAGPVGKVAPLTTVFLNFQVEATAKIFREMRAMFNAADPTRQKEARTFLAMMASSLIVFAGTAGLPFMTVMASVIENIVDLLGDDDEPYNLEASWRMLLNETFGTGFGEAVTRGLPRLLNADMSTRVGLQDLAPFSRLMSTHQTWKEAADNWSSDLLGAPFAMMRSVFEGAEMIADGNVLSGMERAFPVAVRNLIKTVTLTEKGFVDQSGNAIPILSAGASDYLWQALGITPGQLADYRFRSFSGKERSQVLSRQATVLRNQMYQAIESGDTATQQDLLTEIRQFDARNSEFAVEKDIIPGLKRRAKLRAESAAAGVPLGTSLRDIRAVELGRMMPIAQPARE